VLYDGKKQQLINYKIVGKIQHKPHFWHLMLENSSNFMENNTDRVILEIIGNFFG